VDETLAKEGQTATQKDKSGNSTRYVFLPELGHRTTGRERVRNELLAALMAGRDTNIRVVLSNRSDLRDKLQSEFEDLDNEPLTYEQIGEMEFLRALLREPLHLHPVVPQNYRESLEDTTPPVGGDLDGPVGLRIAKGHVVAWSLYAIHCREDLYGDDAEEFRPERWLDEPATRNMGLRWEYFPFNGGPRTCVGQQYALTQASCRTVRLCQAFSGNESEAPRDKMDREPQFHMPEPERRRSRFEASAEDRGYVTSYIRATACSPLDFASSSLVHSNWHISSRVTRQSCDYPCRLRVKILFLMSVSRVSYDFTAMTDEL
jgi:hypothetical protein